MNPANTSPRRWTVKRESHSEATIWDGHLFIASVAAAPKDKDPYLIAAAPELAEALRELLACFWEGRPKCNVKRDYHLMVQCEAARSLLSKLDLAPTEAHGKP